MNRLVTFATVLLCIALLWVGSEVFIPLVLALLLSMLLATPVTKLEKWGLPRVFAVTVGVLAAMAVLVGIGWILSVQVMNLATEENIGRYQTEVLSKAAWAKRYFRSDEQGALSKIEETAKRLEEEFNAPAPKATSQQSTQPATTQATAADDPATQSTEGETVAQNALQNAVVAPDHLVDTAQRALGKDPPAPLDPAGTKDRPFYTVVQKAPASAFETLSTYAGSALGPIGTAGIVIIFTFFILLEREDLRDRMIRLVSQGRYTLTTTAVDDGLTRIIKFMRAQAIVNGTYGLAVAIGLLVISLVIDGTTFPSFLVWGLLAAVLRFIPYVGPWIAAAFPISLSLMAFPGFGVFAAVLGMFLVIELLSNNVMEPMLYGATTGLSTMAILVSAVFWTWLWGPIGLLLATPLTVVMMVLGRHVPGLEFLEVLLGDRPAMTPAERVYQRLLAGDEDEALKVMEEQMAETSLLSAFDEVLLPALAMSERDAGQGLLNEERQEDVRQGARKIIEGLEEKSAEDAEDESEAAVAKAAAVADKSNKSFARVALLPAHDEADELAALMLARLLKSEGLQSLTFSHNALASEMVEEVKTYEPHVVLISATPPAAVSHVKYLLRRFNALPEEQLAIGVWSAETDAATLKSRLNLKKAIVSVSLKDAMESVRRLTEQVRLVPVTD